MNSQRCCIFTGCGGKHFGRGYCQMHYSRVRRHGDPSIVGKPRREYPDAAGRLRDNSIWQGRCLVYTGGQAQRSGHRVMSYRNRQVGAHRVAFELANGPIPHGMCVMHRCDNPPCILVEHLQLGTVADNNRDRDSKGRHVPLPGSRNGYAKLEEWQVAQIKLWLSLGETTYRLAAAFGVTQGNVWRIGAGRAWVHVSPAVVLMPLSLPGRRRKNTLTSDAVARIRESYAAGGVRAEDLAAQYGVTRSTVSSLLRGDTWAAAGGPTARRPKAQRDAAMAKVSWPVLVGAELAA